LRLAHHPVARLLDRREFWGLPFQLDPETLVPRPDTETLVAAALRWLGGRLGPLQILDLGTGSGCLLVALLHEWPDATGLGIDRSFGAARTARRNAERNGVGDRAVFAVGDWGVALGARFDLVVSNPPYIPTGDIGGLAPEVRVHDPVAALDGGADGLTAYRTILAQAGRLLRPGGTIVLEVGIGQADPVCRLAEAAALTTVEIARDLAGIERALVLVGGQPGP